VYLTNSIGKSVDRSVFATVRDGGSARQLDTQVRDALMARLEDPDEDTRVEALRGLAAPATEEPLPDDLQRAVDACRRHGGGSSERIVARGA
jgi:hypothetical protein